MADAVGALTAVMLAAVICGFAGQKIARDQGWNPLFGFALGAMLPLFGVGVLLLLGRKEKAFRS